MNEIVLYDHFLATWNVQGLCDAEAFGRMLFHVEKCKIRIAALQDIRWIGGGNNIYSPGKYTVYYSGSNPMNRLGGTGFVVDDKLNDVVIDFIPVNERICVLRLKYKFYNVTLLSVLAPIEEAEIEIKNDFYYQLDRIYDELPCSDAKIILGDFDARVGKEKFFRPVIGRHSYHRFSNDNGKRLLTFAMNKDMIVKSTCFIHEVKHKATCITVEGERDQTDHCIIDRRHQINILNIKTCKTAKCGSDHMLVKITYRQGKPLVNKDPSKGPIVSKYKNEYVSERVEDEVGEEEQFFTSGSWYDQECDSKLKEGNEARKRMLQGNGEVDREVNKQKRKLAKRICRRAKRYQEKMKRKKINRAMKNNIREKTVSLQEEH